MSKPHKKAATTISKRVIEYYETVANCSKKLTISHFTPEVVKRTTLNSIIRRHEKRKQEKLGKAPLPLKKTTRRCKVVTPENLRRYEELYKMDPLISSVEASQLLDIPRSSFFSLLKAFREKLNGDGTLQLEDQGVMECSGDGTPGESVEVESESYFNCDDGDDDHFNDFQIQPSPKPAPVPISKKKKRISLCLACSQEFQVDPTEPCNNVLTANLNIIFVFKRLLDLSTEELTSIMKLSKGKDPKDWVGFCGKCSELVNEAIMIHSQIMKLETKLRECKGKIVSSIQNTSSFKVKGKSKERCNVTRRVQKILRKRKRERIFSEVNAFEEGDKQAQSKLKSLKSVIPVKPEKVMSNFSCAPSKIEPDIPSEDFIVDDDDGDGGDTWDPMEFTEPEPALDVQVGFKECSIAVISGASQSSPPGPECPPIQNALETPSDSRAPILPTITQGICDMCGLEMRPLAIPMHKLTEHDVVMEGYTVKSCEKEGCDYKTLYDFHFRKHLRNHVDSVESRRYTCRYCGKKFINLKGLGRHEDIHKNVETKPFQCDICGSSFAVRNYLYIHKRVTHEKRKFPSNNKTKTKTKL